MLFDRTERRVRGCCGRAESAAGWWHHGVQRIRGWALIHLRCKCYSYMSRASQNYNCARVAIYISPSREGRCFVNELFVNLDCGSRQLFGSRGMLGLSVARDVCVCVTLPSTVQVRDASIVWLLQGGIFYVYSFEYIFHNVPLVLSACSCVIRACTALAFPSRKLLCLACQLLRGWMSDKNRSCVRFDGCACVLSHVNEWVCSCFGLVACNHDVCIFCFWKEQ